MKKMSPRPLRRAGSVPVTASRLLSSHRVIAFGHTITQETTAVSGSDVAHSFVLTMSLRARAEYVEMPGLHLTVAQAARLFDLDRAICATVLETLVDNGFLRRSGLSYVRADSGRRYA